MEQRNRKAYWRSRPKNIIGPLEQWLNDTEVKREDQQRQERMNFELKLEEANIYKLKAEHKKV
jgi:hypothetical protein